MSSHAGLLNSEHDRNRDPMVNRLTNLMGSIRELERDLERLKAEEEVVKEQVEEAEKDLQASIRVSKLIY